MVQVADESAALGEALGDATLRDGGGAILVLLHVRERQSAELDGVVNARRPAFIVIPSTLDIGTVVRVRRRRIYTYSLPPPLRKPEFLACRSFLAPFAHHGLVS